MKFKSSLKLAVFLDSLCSDRVARELYAKLPCLTIYFAHLSSASLPADLNSKWIERPLDVANSELWCHGPPEYFELGPPSNWFMKITNQELEWKPPQAASKIAQSCYCNNSPDFCGEVGSLAMFCTTCEGNSHICSDLHLHYQFFSSQNLPKVSGIFVTSVC